MTEAGHPLGHINGVYNEKDKSNHVYVVKRLRVAKLELFLLDHIAIKVYEFVLWWPVWVLKKNIQTDLQRRSFPAARRR